MVRYIAKSELDLTRSRDAVLDKGQPGLVCAGGVDVSDAHCRSHTWRTLYIPDLSRNLGKTVARFPFGIRADFHVLAMLDKPREESGPARNCSPFDQSARTCPTGVVVVAERDRLPDPISLSVKEKKLWLTQMLHQTPTA